MTGRPLWFEQEATDVPPDRTWLGPDEREHLDSLTVERRRLDWLLGRWTAKQTLILASVFEESDVAHPSRLEILPGSDGSPRVTISGEVSPVSISLSHRAGRALCCVWQGGAVGCDLELVEPRSEAFCRDYFTSREQAVIASEGATGLSVTANSLWSAKESILKLLKTGLTVDSRLLEVEAEAFSQTSNWQRFSVSHRGISRNFTGWWCRREDWILTVASDPKTDAPIRLVLGEKGG